MNALQMLPACQAPNTLYTVTTWAFPITHGIRHSVKVDQIDGVSILAAREIAQAHAIGGNCVAVDAQDADWREVYESGRCIARGDFAKVTRVDSPGSEVPHEAR